jgi:predicted nucleic acid-binding protein
MGFIMPDEKNSFIDLSEYKVFVPSIFFLECMNVLKSAFSKKRITAEEYEESIWAFKNLPLNVDHFSSTQESLQTIYNICKDNDLTSYDASYLELSMRLKSPLGTLDKQLIKICKNNKIQIL